jgi:hypothetical protein
MAKIPSNMIGRNNNNNDSINNISDSTISKDFYFFYEELLNYYLKGQDSITASQISPLSSSSFTLLHPSIFITHLISSLFDCLATTTKKSLYLGKNVFKKYPHVYVPPLSKTNFLSSITLILMDLLFSFLRSSPGFIQKFDIYKKKKETSLLSFSVSSTDILFSSMYPNLLKYIYHLLDYLLILASVPVIGGTNISSPISPVTSGSVFSNSGGVGGSINAVHSLSPIPLITSSNIDIPTLQHSNSLSREPAYLALSLTSLAMSYQLCNTLLMGLTNLSDFLPFTTGRYLFSKHMNTLLRKYRVIDYGVHNDKYDSLRSDNINSDNSDIFVYTIKLSGTFTLDSKTKKKLVDEPLTYGFPTHLLHTYQIISRVLTVQPPSVPLDSFVYKCFVSLIKEGQKILEFIKPFI